MAAEPDLGWGWFDLRSAFGEGGQDVDLCRRFARCFAGPDGEQVLQHLGHTILDRRLGPAASDAELRHLEGQRFAVAYLLAMVERGRSRP